MQRSSTLVDTNCQLPTGESLLSTTGNCKSTKLSKEDIARCDVSLRDYADIMSPEFKEWYCKAYYAIGDEKFRELAKEARASKRSPAKLFSYLLKKQMS